MLDDFILLFHHCRETAREDLMRHSIERLHVCGIKISGLLRNQVLHWQHAHRAERLVRLAATLFNDLRAPLDDYKRGERSDEKFEFMLERLEHENEIPSILEPKPRFKSSTWDQVPDIDDAALRTYAFGDYAMFLSHRYVVQARGHRNFLKVLQCVDNPLLFHIRNFQSRFSSQKPRIIYLLFEQSGEDTCLCDTLCNCPAGARTLGGCAHAVAAVRYAHECHTGTPIEPSKSEKYFEEFFGADFSDPALDLTSEEQNELMRNLEDEV